MVKNYICWLHGVCPDEFWMGTGERLQHLLVFYAINSDRSLNAFFSRRSVEPLSVFFHFCLSHLQIFTRFLSGRLPFWRLSQEGCILLYSLGNVLKLQCCTEYSLSNLYIITTCISSAHTVCVKIITKCWTHVMQSIWLWYYVHDSIRAWMG